MLERPLARSRGTALIIAVFLLILLAIVAAVFVAFVSHTLAQAGRRVDVEAAERMSNAGVLYVRRQLLTSPEQSNWRPQYPTFPLPPDYYTEYEISRGYASAFPPFVKIDNPDEAGDTAYGLGTAGEEQFGRCLVQVSYVPSLYAPPGPSEPVWGTWVYPTDPATNLYDELSPFIRITSVGSSRAAPNLLRAKVAYIPLVLPDRLLNIVDAEETLRSASVGIPSWVDVDGDRILDSDGNGAVDGLELRELPVSRMQGGFHSNASTIIYGRTWLGDLWGSRGDRVTVAGNITLNDPTPTTGLPLPAGYGPAMAFNRLDRPGGTPYGLLLVSPSINPATGRPTLTTTEFNVASGYVRDNMSLMNPYVDTGPLVPPSDYGKRNAQRLRPGLLDSLDSMGAVRFRRLAQESGHSFYVGPGTVWANRFGPGTYNTALFGLGGTIYINNSKDVQGLDPQALHDNWIRAGAQADAYWYGPLYDPPGCEVIFHEKDIGTAEWDADHSSMPWTQDGRPQRAYGNLPQVPDIEIILQPAPDGSQPYFWVPVTADTNGNGLADDVNDIWTPGIDNPADIVDVQPLDVDPSDTVPDWRAVFDYPLDGCMYFEGNVCVRGKLPISRTDVLDPNPAPDGLYYPWRYDTTLISRGVVYISGNLMTALDWWSPPSGGGPPYVIQDRYAARLALMAEHDIAINATRGEYQGPGITTDCEYIADAPEATSASAGHWLLEPGKSFMTFFGFGGLDLSSPTWTAGSQPADNPMYNPNAPASNTRYAHPDITWRDDLFLKIRVRGTPYSPFDLYINGARYDFDTRPSAAYPAAAGCNPCRQMNGTVQVLCIPLAIDGATVDTVVNSGDWQGGELYIDGSPGGLNSVDIRPALGMTAPLEIFAVSIERRDEVSVESSGSNTVPGGVPLVTPNVSHQWFGWDPEDGPPPLVRAGGDVLHSRTMTVAALCYSQRGSFFVIGGDYFDPLAARVDRNGDGVLVDDPLGFTDPATGIWYPSDTDANKSGTVDWAEDRRYGLQIQYYGAITQNLPPDMTCVADWTDKLIFPIPDLDPSSLSPYAPTPANLTLGWTPVIYLYDPGLRASNPVGGPLGAAPSVTQTVFRLPRIPVSPDLIYFGDLT